MKGKSLLVLGLNPAWQRLFLLDQLNPGAVHRLPQALEFASGKGINFCRVFTRLGFSSHCLQFLAGSRGDAIRKELNSSGLQTTDISLMGETRICTTYSSGNGESTEFIEPSPKVQETEMKQFLSELDSLWGEADSVVVCGTAPAGFEWSKLNVFNLEKKRIYLDAWAGVTEWLKTGVELLKLNGEELARLLDISTDAECLDVFAMSKLAFQKYSMQYLVVTQGARRVLVFAKNFYLSLCPPRATPFVNAIGAGDAFMAGWVSSSEKGLGPKECLAKAVAVSVARCEVALPWEFDLDRISQIEKENLSRVEENPWIC